MAAGAAARVCLILLTALTALYAGMSGSAAQGMQPVLAGMAAEYEIKAAYLYKFLSYVELPPAAAGGPDTAITVGVIDADEVAAELARIAAGRTVGNRPVTVRRMGDKDSLSGLQAVFIGGSDRARLNRVLKAAQQRSILTVTEAEGALDQGSVINFRTVDGKVRFEVSLEAAEKSDIRLSSRMLAVALNVHRAGQ